MKPLRIVASLLGLALAATAGVPAAAGFVDVLDTPAVMSPLASRSLIQAIAKAGDRIVAVGQRGHIVVSSDNGATWKQSPVPVSSDLTAVYFVDAREGWATGHDGVILHTADGGDTWALQLNGRTVNELLVKSMEAKVAGEPASDDAKKLLAEAQRYKEQGADKPFLDVWFADAKNGYAVGAYNLIFRTSDGGTSWESWFDRTDNPKFFNLYSIRPAGGDVYIAGEGGILLKLDRAAQRFKAQTSGYNGSFFGIAEAGNAAIAFGLRGNAYRTDNAGATWIKVETGLPGAITAAARTSQGALLLADVGGRVVRSTDGGRTFAALAIAQPAPLTAIADLGDGRVVQAGPRGVAVSTATIR